MKFNKMYFGQITLIYLAFSVSLIRAANLLVTVAESEHELQNTAASKQHELKQTLAAANQPRHQSYDKLHDVDEHDTLASMLGEEEQQQLINEYETNDDVAATLAHKRDRRELSDWLIAPNTRWCGKGNTANGTYNHLGGASAADKCCRKHDHCQKFIPGMSNRYEMFNYRPYTVSHCNCDRRFRTCLKMANDDDSRTIGKLFFNLVQTQCFVLKTERTCRRRNEDGSCAQEQVRQKAYLRKNRTF